MRGHDGLDVSRESSGNSFQIYTFVREVNFDARIDKLSYIYPVVEVSRTPVNLVNDDAVGFLRRRVDVSRRKCWATLLRRGLPLFEPSGDSQIVTKGVAEYRVFLFL